MKFAITENEKEITEQFIGFKIPPVYNTDNTDSLAFVERVYSEICPLLLKGKTINGKRYNEIENNYKEYLNKIVPEDFDEYALAHYKQLLAVMEIFKKYYFTYPEYGVCSDGIKPSFSYLLKNGFSRDNPASFWGLLSCSLIGFACLFTVMFSPSATIKTIFGIILAVDALLLFVFYILFQLHL